VCNNNEVERGVGLAIPRKEASRGPGSRIARRKWVFGRLFRGASRRVIGWRKFCFCKLFTLKFSGTNCTNCPVVCGPYHFKQVGLLVCQALLAWFKELHGYNVAASQLCPSVEAAPDFGNIFNQSALGESMACAINPRNFNRDAYRETLFYSLLVIDCDRLSVWVLAQCIRLAHGLLNCK